MTPRAQVRQRVRGLYGLADAEASAGDPIRIVVALLDGGCRLVQLRCKGWSVDELERAAADAVARCHAVGATFIVNDVPEVAAAVGADGVHVGQLDGSPAEVRAAIGPDRILGRSSNDVGQLLDAAGHADYVAFGPVYETPRLSHPKPVRGLARLVEARRRLPVALPLVAIGGITPERLAPVRRAGADSWAVIGRIAHADDPVAATRTLLG
jgi:thiamine-phosphate pyrophosphorylase